MQLLGQDLVIHDTVAYEFALRLDPMTLPTDINPDTLMHDLAMRLKKADPVRTLSQLDKVIRAIRTLRVRIADQCVNAPRKSLDPILVGSMLLLVVGLGSSVFAVWGNSHTNPANLNESRSRDDVVTTAIASATARGLAMSRTSLVSDIGSYWGLVPEVAARAAACKAASMTARTGVGNGDCNGSSDCDGSRRVDCLGCYPLGLGDWAHALQGGHKVS
ncbi:hypothetical protein BCR44DRAFT_41076 [Catenaria anguillulae PL171]|uniref:Uncharacterized protein n=1 Tax=Catenaria anguillulae PL171 TaxID=765915 RepID=A0A1Y2HFI6_9FUNG|nr:hypothetical protein BCR44DRAFT_41076 [Catenaria anguillulae PL171]